MDKYIYDDKNGMWYELQGDYYIPCFILPAEKEQPIGLWGRHAGLGRTVQGPRPVTNRGGMPSNVALIKPFIKVQFEYQ